MKLKIICAVSIAVIALSCDKASDQLAQKDQKLATVTDAGIAEPQSMELVKKSNVTLDEMENASTADTSATAVQAPNDVLQSGSPINPDWDKKIIKTANITLELKDYKAYNTSIHARVKDFGAYVAQENQNETDDQITNTITIKVPVDKFDDLVNSLPGENIKVIEKNIATEDVTGDVVDTRARLEAKKQVRDRYLELLKQAKNMNEILQVQTEINSIQEDIESASGRVNYLVHASAYSTINLKYYQFKNGVTQKDIEPNFFTKLVEAFGNGLTVISDIILFIISIWPLMTIALIAFFYFKRVNLKKA